jgi:FlaA1/EpsC-like NDP-sugar epimerase
VRNILVVGAGTAGNEVVKTLKSGRNKQYIPIGFIDIDKSLHGKQLQGVKVLGDLFQLRHIIKKHRIHEIFIAIPEATNKVVREIMDAAKIPEWEVKFKIVPSMLDIMSGRHSISKIRPVSIDDLLSRPNIRLDDTHIRRQLAAKTVLITGAGGSIGSELCFQVAAYKPSRMILLDASEQCAYNLDQELKKQHPDIAIHTVVGNVLDTGFVEPLFKQYPPDYIYHAAAYKHVHLMEWNPIACLKNNVLGTAALAALAEKHGVSHIKAAGRAGGA